ncbi:cyclodeaminase/cyclohydrolase family protein [Allonocardiopsis opalescens]|uniref:Formiminotetrahydrofolate cyclodeaminase n=1 Tax=Allonocardiopsis opalescens TaxID=1144618 RepID=A0A2T0Q508_9ACTN|nr:cyclodeaminase/cyclohydrolase family protein [Allonocardiopsis opalescens]PRX98905.1 formiminotetrahydrofolate cyclodeaminase [Allonocardiopsis opalescens]
MRDQTIGEFLDRLASRDPAPGGGASAALHAAQGAALLGMVARYSTGEKYAEHAEEIERITEEVDRLRERALELAERDAVAFTKVTDAYRLPKDTEDERGARSRAIAAALVGAGAVPAEVIVVARRLVGLTEELLPIGNPHVATDVAAAAEAVRAALTTARVNVEVNLKGITDDTARAQLAAVVADVDRHVRRTAQVTEAVRAELSR